MEAQEIQQKELHTMRGELALLVAVLINSFGVVLMLHSGAGISAISSVPFAFSEVFTRISLGTWTYLFQGVLVLSLMILRKRFVPQYLFSFVVGFVFGELLDVHEADITGAAYSNIKVSFDVICLAVTAGMTIFFLGHLDGLGIGTILAAFTMGKVIGAIGKWMDGRLRFVSVLTPKTAKPC